MKKILYAIMITLITTPSITAQDNNNGILIRKLSGHTGIVFSVAFSPDGSTLASGSDDNTIHLWNAHDGTLMRKLLGHTDSVFSVAFSPDENIIASGSWDNTLRLWNANTEQHMHTLERHTSDVLSVAFSPDGTTLASGSADATICLWDTHTGQHIRTISGYWQDDYNCVAFSPDGTTLASGDGKSSIKLWDPHSKHRVGTLSGHTDIVSSVAFSPDGTTLASGSYDNTIRLWNIDTRQHIYTLVGHTNDVLSVAFSPDGTTLASGSYDNTIRLYDVDTKQHIRTLRGHTGGIRSVAFSPNGNTIASGSLDKTVMLWKLPPLPTTNAVVNLSPDSMPSPYVGKQLTLSLNIVDGQKVAGYQVNVFYDTSTLKYVSSKNDDYLPIGAYFIPPLAEGNSVQLAASSLAGETMGDGTLATITFEVIAVKYSVVRLSDVILTDSAGGSSVPLTENAEITIPPQLSEDMNDDGVVNIIDLTLVASNFGKTGENAADVNGDGVVNIIDLTLVAAAFGNTAADAAPALWSFNPDNKPTRATVEAWLKEARQLNLADLDFQRGILFLENLLNALTPKATALLPNYPNPFNPETWIPYQLASPANVRISIWTEDGKLIRQLDLGDKSIGIYQDRDRAAFWDGRNENGEKIASGVYFYTLTADDFSATRKMLIRK